MKDLIDELKEEFEKITDEDIENDIYFQYEKKFGKICHQIDTFIYTKNNSEDSYRIPTEYEMEKKEEFENLMKKGLSENKDLVFELVKNNKIEWRDDVLY